MIFIIQVDHSIIIYLIDPDGEFVDYFGTFVTGEQVAQAVEFQMKKYEKMKNAWWTKYIPSYIKKNPQSSWIDFFFVLSVWFVDSAFNWNEWMGCQSFWFQ